MRKPFAAIATSALGAASIGLVGSGVASAAPQSPSRASTSAVTSYEAVSGVFKTMSATHARVKALRDSGFRGFTAEVRTGVYRTPDRKYEAEHQYHTKKRAKAEVRALHRAGFHGFVQRVTQSSS